jgi:thiol-disulfide isomerase/thioredoxin
MSPQWLGLRFCAISALGMLATAPLARAQADGPTVESVLRRTADFFKGARSLSVTILRVDKVGDATLPTSVSVALERPNRFAIRARDGGHLAALGTTFAAVCDGKTLSVSIPAARKYTEADAPVSFDAALSDPMTMIAPILQPTLIGELCFGDPFAKLMEGVKSARYAGADMIDGTRCHHLAFTQDQFQWELWLAVDGDPAPRRAVFDFSELMARRPAANTVKNQKFETVLDYKNWRIGPDLDARTFAFQPPAGAKKVNSFVEGFPDQNVQPPSRLLGEPAPDVTLKTLDGGDFRLEDHGDTHLVVLAFWATWCGPCFQVLPILAEVAQAYKDKGVVFCGVNLREKPEPIRAFLDAQKLDFTVALDSLGRTGEAYQASALPILVLIDKKGVVQSVHIGYSPAIKTMLRKELDDLLAGTDLAGMARARQKAGEARRESETKGLVRAWSARGSYTSAAANPQGATIYAQKRAGRCDVLDASVKTIRTFLLAGSDPAAAEEDRDRSARIPPLLLAGGDRMIARFARVGPGGEGLVTFPMLGPTVLASRADGTKLWEETGGEGIDDVWPADLDGDGRDEVIVGYNGATGLHVFGPDGKRLWKRTDLGNVWHVTAGDLDGDGRLEVVTTSAQGKVHVFAAGDGQALRTLDPGLYARMVRTVPASAPGRTARPVERDLVLVAGGVLGAEVMVALKGDGKADPGLLARSPVGAEFMAALGDDGKPRWAVELPADAGCDSMAVSPDGTMAALGLDFGRVCVVDIRQGQIVAHTTGQGLMTPMVSWAARGGSAPPLLLVATGDELNAFEVEAAQGDRRPSSKGSTRP